MIARLSRLLLLVLVAAGVSLPAPVLAQGTLGFGTFFGYDQKRSQPLRVTCLTNHQIRESVAARGYSDVFLNVPNDGRIEVRATYEGWVYLIDFDYCRDRVIGARALRPAQ